MNAVLGGICGLVALVIAVIFLIDMFKDAVWKGIVGLLCGLYMVYWVLVESKRENKWPLVIGYVVCAVLAGFFLRS